MPRDAVSRTANVGTVGKNGLSSPKSRTRFQQASEGKPLVEASSLPDKNTPLNNFCYASA